MSVVTRSAWRRRGVALAVAVAVVLVPTAVGAGLAVLAGSPSSGTATAAEPSPRELLATVAASADVAHQGLAESRGDVGLPDLPSFGPVARLLGGTTRARVWWAGEQRWRVDRLTATGEDGLYAVGAMLVDWDFAADEVTVVAGEPAVRLPRVDDVLPPQAARRLVGGVGPADRVSALPARRVAGMTGAGVRVVPASPRSSLQQVDVWVDVDSGLPLRVDVVADGGQVAFTTAFLDVDLQLPDAGTLYPPEAPGARRTITSTPDIAAAMDAVSPVGLPDTLAGMASVSPLTRGTAQYADGLARMVVLPLPHRLGHRVYDGARDGGGQELDVTGGRAVLLRRGVLSAAVVHVAERREVYVVAGIVDPQTVTDAATELLADPPTRDRG